MSEALNKLKEKRIVYPASKFFTQQEIDERDEQEAAQDPTKQREQRRYRGALIGVRA